jgi:hypothetical protein
MAFESSSAELLLLLLLLLLQVLFIDRHDQLRARLAAGLFEKVCA